MHYKYPAISLSCLLIRSNCNCETLFITPSFLSPISDTCQSNTYYLFINKNGDELTRSGVRTRINKLVSQATAQVPSLREKTVTLHTF